MTSQLEFVQHHCYLKKHLLTVSFFRNLVPVVPITPKTRHNNDTRVRNSSKYFVNEATI